MEVRVEVVAENPLNGITRITNIAYLVYVALDPNGRPTPVPGLDYETDLERIRAKEAQERQEFRKRQRN
jgi:acyl-CoA hydrolase